MVSSPIMGCDLDRRCAKQQDELRERIATLDALMVRYPHNKRAPVLYKARNETLIELHEMERSHRAYDRRLDEAMDDPTGQDLDSFYEMHGE